MQISHKRRFPRIGVLPQSSILILHYKPSILGYLHLWKPLNHHLKSHQKSHLKPIIRSPFVDVETCISPFLDGIFHYKPSSYGGTPFKRLNWTRTPRAMAAFRFRCRCGKTRTPSTRPAPGAWRRPFAAASSPRLRNTAPNTGKNRWRKWDLAINIWEHMRCFCCSTI